MNVVDGEVLSQIAPHVTGAKLVRQKTIIAALSDQLQATLADFDINSRLRIAHFLAQACHESDGFSTTVEYAPGDAYEDRADLGNTQPGDGRRFKGRGLFQLTGRANYKAFGEKLGVDLIANPAVAAEPLVSLRIACEYWKERKINPNADADDIITVTKKINGGLNGLAERRAYLSKAKAALVRLEAMTFASTDPSEPPVLRRGSKGDEVAALQARLSAAGYPIAIDADFGAATELAVMHFQAASGLEADGIAGPKTLAKLPKAAAPAP